MATTEHFYTGNNSTTSFAFTFPYLANSDVKVELDNVLKTENSSGQTNNDYSISNTNIVFNTAPGSGVSVHIFRTTNVDTAQATYAAGSSIRAIDLNNNQTQVLYSSQEQAGQLVRQSGLKDSIVSSAKIVDGTIVDADISGSAAIAQSKIATGNLPSGITVNSSNIVDGSIVAGDLATGTLDSRYFTETELVNGQLDTRYYTETELNNGQLDNRYYTETEAEAKFLRQDSSETIASGVSWSNSDAFVATTAAINARIIDLVDDVGGFSTIANETSFPNSNPQGTTGQAAILSVGALSQSYAPSGTTVSITNGTVGNSTVTITGVPTTLPSGFGILVESTSTLNTYTFHRLVPKATEVTTVAANASSIATAATNVADINNFSDLYQIGNSAPTQRSDGTSLQDGDLWFDNSNDNLRVYDGSNWAIISPAQSVLNDIAIVSGAITYQEDLGLISDAVTTGSSNGSLDIVADILEDEATFTVTAATGKFIIDGVDKPALTLYKGWTYTFDLSDASNATHPFRFQSGGSAYSTNVTVTGTQRQSGAKIVIKIPESQPTSFQYYCTNHSGMGNTITVKDDPIKTVADSVTNITAVAGNSTNINAVAGNATNINTVASTASNVNRYADEYQISGSAPSSPSSGDLWFSTSANILNYYNGTAWVGISPGIAGLINDANPQLANHLDCNDKNLTEVGTVSGNNLQLDFGTL